MYSLVIAATVLKDDYYSGLAMNTYLLDDEGHSGMIGKIQKR